MRIEAAPTGATPVPAVAAVVRPHLRPLVRATGAARGRPFLHNVRKNVVRGREREEAIRRLVPAVVSVGTRVRNGTHEHRLALLPRERKNDVVRAIHEPLNGLPLPERKNDVDHTAALPGAVRSEAEIGARRCEAKKLPDGDRPTGARQRIAETGASTREDINPRTQLVDIDNRAGVARPIAAPRTIEADSARAATVITRLPIGMVEDTVIASHTTVADMVLTTRSATVHAITVMAATECMAGEASTIAVIIVERSAITAVTVLAASAIRGTAVEVAVDTRMRDSPGTDIAPTARMAMSPASIAGKAGVDSPILITGFLHDHALRAGIAANSSWAGL